MRLSEDSSTLSVGGGTGFLVTPRSLLWQFSVQGLGFRVLGFRASGLVYL